MATVAFDSWLLENEIRVPKSLQTKMEDKYIASVYAFSYHINQSYTCIHISRDVLIALQNMGTDAVKSVVSDMKLNIVETAIFNVIVSKLDKEIKQEYSKKLQEQKCMYERLLVEQHNDDQQEFNQLKQKFAKIIKNLEIQLAETVAAHNVLEKSNKEKYDSLNRIIAEKNMRVNKIEIDYEELQRKYTELQKEKQELQFEFDVHVATEKKIKNLLSHGSNKKRKLSEMMR